MGDVKVIRGTNREFGVRDGSPPLYLVGRGHSLAVMADVGLILEAFALSPTPPPSTREGLFYDSYPELRLTS
jgi:hypothetical protein